MDDAAAISGAGLFADPLTDRIGAFIRQIGIEVAPATLATPGPCPGVEARHGVLLVDEARLAYPGDLLHEAGHVAVCDPAVRRSLAAIGDDPGEEMAAMAWSYAAARWLEIDPAIVFHAAGYKGGAQSLLEAFNHDGPPGAPMLEWFGMTLSRRKAEAEGARPFPHMLRWLR
ncbi:MAG TPA: hypothetical protein VN814_23635 [Caulobacteraceae bacterium]|nr:hypothetical protein [Caulobacteraceae bacterium]